MLSKLSIFRVPRVTGLRIALALLVAVVLDGVQFILGWLGPVEWFVVDPGLDLVGMVLTNWILGFHVLLLPTFIVKLVPVLEQLPTWTACVATVIALRKREQHLQDAVIEVETSQSLPRSQPPLIPPKIQ